MFRYIFVLLAALLIMKPVFADDDMSTEDKPCAAIVKSCLDAGYVRHATGKQFWKDCMKPLLLGNSVTGVNVNATDVSTCRTAKISKLEQELSDLKAVQ